MQIWFGQTQQTVSGNFRSDERVAKVEDLKFVCDDVIREAIERGREESEKFEEELQVEVVDCQGVGRNELKHIKVVVLTAVSFT